MILDYSTYITDKGTRGIVNGNNCNKNIDLFQHKPICPFCNQPIGNIVYSKQKKDEPDWLFGTFEENELVIQCPICGWWEYKYINQSDAITEGIRASDVEYDSAVLKQYNNNDSQIPVETLRKYLLKKPEIIYEMDAHKLEEVVRSVFADFYPGCVVTHFGKTRDGGKDAILIDADGKQTIVQVKRRTKPDATEGVGFVTALLGVSIVEDNPKGCIFVSSADHFSKDAKDFAQKAIDKQIVERFDLIDCASFLKQVDLVKDKLPDSWEKLTRL